MNINISKVLFFVCLLGSSLFADIVLGSKHQNIELSGIDFYEDVEGDLNLEEVQKHTFLENENSVASFGFTSSAYWFRIPVQANDDARSFKWWFKVSYPLLDSLDLYICDDKGTMLAVKRAGKARAFDQRELKDRNFLFQIEPAKKQILYLRVSAQSSMQVPMQIQSSESLAEDEQYLLVLSGIYYGLFILIFFYNLISLMYTRSRKYLLYLLFISSFILYQLSLDGLGMQYFWSDWDWMISHGNGTMMGITMLAVIMFSREFLKTKQHTPKIDKILLLLSVFLFLLAAAGVFRPYGDVIMFLAIIALIIPPLLLMAGIILYRKKFYPARFYIAGWGSFLLGSVFFAMNKFSWIEGWAFLSYAQQIGSAMEMIFLSWGLADLQKQKEREYFQKLSELNTLLQQKVDESLLKVRQNDQVLIEKSRLAAMGEMIEQIAHQWRQPLNSLALLNQNLYFKVQLGKAQKDDYIQTHDKINDQLQYMSQTIDDFRNFSQPNKEKEEFFIEEVLQSTLDLSDGSLKQAKIKAHIFSAEDHLIYGMRHEMMQVFMNMIKNVHDVVIARKIYQPWLKIFVEERDHAVHILFEDNAGGLDENIMDKIFQPYFSTKSGSESSGIGMYMSKEIIEKSMSGTIGVTNSGKGAVFEIILPRLSSDKS